MHLNTREHGALARVFALLAEGGEGPALRLRLGEALLDLLQADHFASFVWHEDTRRFEQGVWLHMDPVNLARYDAWYQYHDPITLKLQARRHATAVSAVMPHADLARTEFFNDFLARDGLHWGVNLHAFDGERALGDLRIWRGRHRHEFDAHDLALLDLIEPALVAALRRAKAVPAGAAGPGTESPITASHITAWHTAESGIAESPTAVHAGATRTPAPTHPPLSPREREVADAVARGLTDKQIARALGLSPTSVRTYLNRLFEKTGTQRRAALARWAARD